MKKTLILFSALLLSAAAVNAQTVDETKVTDSKAKVETAEGDKVKVKPKTTTKDKAYNLVHRNKKRSHGVKVKGKTAEGEKVNAEVQTNTTTTRKDD